MPLFQSKTPETDRPLKYMQQLDGLRAIAVIMVFWTHYLHKKYWLFGIYWGSFGVRLFFVLSGFLITGILLQCRNHLRLGQSPLFILRQFYIRRFLRLFPLYYTIIGLMAIINIPPVREALIWHLAYLSNIRYAYQGAFDLPVSHFWSLSVEEQFYLIWPCIILFSPKKLLLPIIVLAISIAPVFRLVTTILDFNQVAIWVLTPSSFDTLGLGALLAYLTYERKDISISKSNVIRVFLLIGLPATIILQILGSVDSNNLLYNVLGDTAVGLTFAWLVANASIGFKGFTGKLLESQPLVYLGKMSYGIYLIHAAIPSVYLTLVDITGFPKEYIPTRIVLILLTISTLILATLSWVFLEKPINELKRNFPYTKNISDSQKLNN